LKGEGRLGKREKEKRKEGRELGSRLLLLCVFFGEELGQGLLLQLLFFGLLLLLIGGIDMV
jgi:hypothetical protein